MAIKHALLSLLDQAPRGVGRLRTDFEQATAHTWPINVGQVYQTIRRLARDGLVEEIGQEPDPDSGRNVALYAITPEGQKLLHQWLATASASPVDTRDELVMKLALAAVTGWDVAPMIQTQREAVLDRLRELTFHTGDLGDEFSAEKLARERQIFALEAEGRFLDRAEHLLAASIMDDYDTIDLSGEADTFESSEDAGPATFDTLHMSPGSGSFSDAGTNSRSSAMDAPTYRIPTGENEIGHNDLSSSPDQPQRTRQGFAKDW